METLIAILLIIIVFINITFFFYFYKKQRDRTDSNREQDKSAQLLLQHLNDLNKNIDERLGASAKEMQESVKYQAGQSQKIIENITEKLVRLDETNKQVLSFSDQLKRLQDTLTNPKQRGVLGEYYLEETLKNVLPPNSYEMQYQFSDGMIADAVVFVKEKIVPIDSKFSLENYERLLDATDPTERANIERQFKNDLKNRIDETSKYVRPTENTTEFAFMFIPSESIYYDLLVNKIGTTKVDMRDLIEYAFRDRKVVIVSPTSFLAYLQTVLQGLRAMQIEDSAKEIRKNVESLAKHINKYDNYLQKLGGHLGTTVNAYNSAYKEFKKIDKDIVRIAEKGGDIDPIEITGPEKD